MRLGTYYGSKHRLAGWVLAHLPRHTCYCEAFGGSAAVLLHRYPPAPVEVYNDLDGELVLTFRVLRERTLALAEALAATPYAREEVEVAYQAVPDDHPDRELEIARRFLVRAGQTRGGPSTRWKSGWRFQRGAARGAYPPARWACFPEVLQAVAQRLRYVQIEHATALTVLRRFDAPATCFYLDPPYLPTERAPQWRGGGYRHEMTEAEHRELAERLHALRGMAVISGYASDLYDELYTQHGWQQICTTAHDTQQAPVVECLWLSPAAQQHAPQLRLF